MRAKAAESAAYPRWFSAMMDDDCQPNPAGKILEMDTSAVTMNRLARPDDAEMVGGVSMVALSASALEWAELCTSRLAVEDSEFFFVLFCEPLGGTTDEN